MCQNLAPLGYKNVLVIGDCLSLNVPDYPGQTSNKTLEVCGYAVSVTVPHDQNVPSGIHVNVYHRGFLVWYNNHTFQSVPEALREFQTEMIKNIRVAINWIQNQ